MNAAQSLIRLVADAVAQARGRGLDDLGQTRYAADRLRVFDPTLSVHDAVRLAERLRPG